MDNVTPAGRITLRNLKIAKFASKETVCFAANVYFDGTFLGSAENDGNGGCTFFHNGNDEAERVNLAEAYALSVRNPEDGQSFDGPLVDLIDELVYEQSAQKEALTYLRRTLKKKVLYLKDGKIWSLAFKGQCVDKRMIDECKRRNPGMPVLNEMPIEHAVKAVMEATA